MFVNYVSLCSLLFLTWKVGRTNSFVNRENDRIISISSILGDTLVFPSNRLDESAQRTWYKGKKDLQSLLSSEGPITIAHGHNHSNASRFNLLNRTILIVEKTFIGDEGFYTLKIHNLEKEYLYHVVLFADNLSLIISSSVNSNKPFYAGQLVNITCSVTFFADHRYIDGFESLWSMIIYNNDPDRYELRSHSMNSFTYFAYFFNYEFDRNDHNQSVTCVLIEHQSSSSRTILNVTSKHALNIQYKAHLLGNYYFIHSFPSHSSIHINCEEFDGNPSPLYTLLWYLNGENRTLLNKSVHGYYIIDDATWRHRGNYTCLAENELNQNQPAHQSFRLNIWFDEHHTSSLGSVKYLTLQQPSSSVSYKWIFLLASIIIFLFACLSFILSCYCFCSGFVQKTTK